MAQTPNGTSDPKRIAHFCEILEHCVRECADTRCGPHDVFLWNARRLSEAILYALAVGTDILKTGKNPAPDLRDLPKRLVEAQQLPFHLQFYFDTLRVCGNVGAHTQGPDVPADDDTIESCKTAIVHVVEWFYRSSKVARPMPVPVAADLVELESDKPKPSRSQRHESELRLLHARCTDAEGTAEELKRQLSKVTSALSTQPNATPTVTEVVAMAKSGQSVARKALLLAAGMALGGAIAWLAMQFQESVVAKPAPSHVLAAAPTCPPAPACPAAAACPPRDVPVPAPAAATALAEPAAPAAAAPGDAVGRDELEPIAGEAEAGASGDATPTCSRGAALVTAGRLAIGKGPWPRPKTWGSKLPKPAPQDVAAFCLAESAITTNAFLTVFGSGSCRPGKGNAKLKGAGGLPINHVTWGCARAYCEELGGTLPTIAQWEHAVRSGSKVGLARNTGEFTLDSRPFAVLGFGGLEDANKHVYLAGRMDPRPSDGSPWLSWQLADTAVHGLPNVSFRCAWPAKSSTGSP